MTDTPSAPARPRHTAIRRQVLLLALLTVTLALVASFDDLHAWLIGFLPAAETAIRQRPIVGEVTFVLFSAAAAMLAFVSSAVIVPVGVYVWGKATTMGLLWLGWILGGVCAYVISRYLGRPVANALGSRRVLARYEDRISQRASFGLVLLFQTAMPSEVPGYLLGLVRYHFGKYLAALALAELPYAVATIYLGAGFVERRTALLIGVGAALTAFSAWALYTLHARFSARP